MYRAPAPLGKCLAAKDTVIHDSESDYGGSSTRARPSTVQDRLRYRGRCGLGYLPPSMGRKRKTYANHSPRGRGETGISGKRSHSSDSLMCLSWNAGNLDRPSVACNALVEFCTQNWDLVMLQEASSTSLRDMAAARGMCHSIPRDGNVGAMAVLAGEANHQVITPLYGHSFKGDIPKLITSRTQRTVGCFYACQVSWFAAELDTEEERHAELL